MDFASRITRSPLAFDAERGAEARGRMAGVEAAAAQVIAGAAGCSPYLAQLIAREGGWLGPALDDPEAAVATEFAALAEVAPDQLAVRLRQGKRRMALLIALCDLGGVWPLARVTGTLTDFADLAVSLALRAEVGAEVRRGRIPGAAPEEQTGGLVALAMGKMGAGELNYSSDIDLICLIDETRYERADFHEARAALIRATRRMAAMLSDISAEGYVFRTDLRLRPDPAVTPVAMAMAAAETYYESLGRTWERAAYIKARAAAGDIAAGEGFLDTLRPFVWRRHLDFAAIRDAHDMRLRIRAHKGLAGPVALPGHDMKLGRGGIREIEFFTQTRQLISGGRDPDLRVRGTVEGLARLAAKGWVPEADAEALTGHYRFHREIEHRCQMVQDAQTHRLPTGPEGFDRLAAFCGRDRAGLERELTERLTEVHALTEGFFAQEAGALGFATDPQVGENPLESSEIVARWPTYAALRSERAVEIFRRLRPEILGRLAEAAKPEEALIAFDGFLAGLPAGVQLFSLFEANPQLIDLMVDIAATAPALSRHLSRNSRVLDAVIGGDFFAPWPGQAVLAAELGRVLAEEADYEKKLDAARRWGKEWHFRVGVHLLRDLIGAGEAGRQYADLAGAMLTGLWPEVLAQFATRHGPPPGRGAVVLGMGSLGAERLNAGSDLDLIVIYDPLDEEQSAGPRPLAVRLYYARLTQALVTAMTAPMAEGRVYEIDMRLRPSGSQGPVATSWQSFRTYQREEAWVWEHLALTRARVVCGSEALGADVETFRREIMGQDDRRGHVLHDVAEMRARIAAAKALDGPWDAKIGRGRMQDIELVAQAGALLSGVAARDVASGIEGAVAVGWISAADGRALRSAHAFMWQVQVASRLLSEAPLEAGAIGAGAAALLSRVTGERGLGRIEARLGAEADRAGAIIEAALPKVEEDGT